MLKRVGQSLVPFARAGLTQTAESFRGVSSQFFDAPNGPSVKQVLIEDEWYNRQRSIFPLLDKEPYYPVDVFVAPNAVVCGDVDIYGGVSSPGAFAARGRRRSMFMPHEPMDY